MKNYIYLLFSFLVLNSFSQTIFWTENFGTGCTQGQDANAYNPSGLGNWSVVNTGTNGSTPNFWYVSSTEAGMGLGNCGDGCMSNSNLSNRSLHIGFDLSSILPGFLDMGASYSAGSGYETDKRAESPLINCSGKNNITLSFLYIAGGIAASDFFEVHYSADGGTTWTVIATPAATNNSVCAGQGLWTNYSLGLPASADNNSNVKIGFRWVNSDPSGSDPSVALDDINLSAPSTFAPSFTVTSPVCTGVSQTLTANTGTYAVSGYTWSANPSGATFSSPNSSTTAVNFATANVYTITLTASSGTTTASSTQTLVVNVSPAISAFAMPSPGCQGQQFTLTATGAITYTWNPGNLTGASVIITPTNPGSYTVVGTANNGCTAAASTAIGMYNSPVVNVSASSSVICSGNSTTLSATGASTYTWDPGNITGSSVVVNPTISTTYTVTGSLNGTPCSNTKTIAITVSPCTGITKIASENVSYLLYPNPASDKLNITSFFTRDVTIEITDALAKAVINQNHSFKDADEKEINISHLAPGIYFIKIGSGSDTEVIRFVKE